jgi:FixJ family two-component response regulator
MRQGAVDFLQKPVDEVILLETVNRAVAAAGAGRARENERLDAIARLARLSPREHEILGHVVRGRLNKQIAGDLGIAEATVKQHRGRVMEKMAVRSVADLVRLCELAALPPSYQGRIPGNAAQA